MSPEIFEFKQTQEIITYIRQKYHDELEFLWQNSPRNAVWRNQENQKWYALLLTIPRNKLPGEISDETVEIINLRFQKNQALDFAESHTNIFPGYHMNKNNWITIILDNSMETKQILDLIDQSYDISLNST